MEKLIHQIVGPNRNKLIDICLDSWKALNNMGYRILVWNDNSITHFLKKYYPFAEMAFSCARNHGEAADIARYLIVYHYGGCYTDWDIELLLPELFAKRMENYPNGFLIIDPVNNTLAPECFAAKKKNHTYLHYPRM